MPWLFRIPTRGIALAAIVIIASWLAPAGAEPASAQPGISNISLTTGVPRQIQIFGGLLSVAGSTLVRWTAAGMTTRVAAVYGFLLSDELPAGVPGACYQLRAGPPALPALYATDILCASDGVRSGASPDWFNIALLRGETQVTLRWYPVAGAAGYLVVPLGTSRVQSTVAAHAVDETGGVPTCYVVLAVSAPGGTPTVSGVSEVVCALPRTGIG